MVLAVKHTHVLWQGRWWTYRVTLSNLMTTTVVNTPKWIVPLNCDCLVGTSKTLLIEASIRSFLYHFTVKRTIAVGNFVGIIPTGNSIESDSLDRYVDHMNYILNRPVRYKPPDRSESELHSLNFIARTSNCRVKIWCPQEIHLTFAGALIACFTEALQTNRSSG